MEPNDAALVAAYLERGDHKAFRQLVERHQERVFSYLMGMVRDREVANDLFQETFLRVIAAMQHERGQYERQGRWLAWVLRIARNTTLDYLRSRKKWQDVGYDDDEESYWDRLPSDEAPLDEALHEGALQERLAACIEALPPEQKEVVVLRHQADLTFREIAELTDCSINTALGRMRYALNNLRRMLQPEVLDQEKKIYAE